MKFRFHFILVILLGVIFINASKKVEWGFFGHRKINRMAVFTLPPPMNSFFKENIEYLTEHAVDPDKRRYATKHEAHRHYIDIDVWDEYPFDTIPKTWLGALMKYTDVYFISEENDSIQVFGNELLLNDDGKNLTYKSTLKDSIILEKKIVRSFFYNNILPNYYEDKWNIECDSFQKYFADYFPIKNCKKVRAYDRFSQDGVLPYHLVKMQRSLTKAFQAKDKKAILRLSAEFGHYIGDAHVPLHTTVNYNGQLTGQTGIHGFWESRLPELMADEEYDFFVGKAEYIENPNEFYWNIIEQSHLLVDSVLLIEADLAKSFPSDQQYCYEKRNDLTVRMPCKAYALAYAKRMNGMVEDRMTSSIKSLGSAWYTAWVNAGQPDLSSLGGNLMSEEERKEFEDIENSFKSGTIKGREH